MYHFAPLILFSAFCHEPIVFVYIVLQPSMWNMKRLQFLPRSSSELQPVLKYGVFSRSACSPIASARGRADLADQRHDLVTLDQLLRLGDRGLRVDAVLGDHLELAAEDAARAVDLLDRERAAAEPVLAELPQEAGARSDVAELDRVRLPAHDGGKAKRRDCGGA